VFEALKIKSSLGEYEVKFDQTSFEQLDQFVEGNNHFIIDEKLVGCYPDVLKSVIENPRTILIEASESSKAIIQVLPIIEKLIANGMRRDQTIVAIGGGIIQDITCFISTVLFRGVNWKFIPTTLLSQADSCIGSKSSINLGKTKNILGSFKPPSDILINPMFLQTLDKREIFSGVGEILKVHVIGGVEVYDSVASVYDSLFRDPIVLLEYIKKSLLIKKKYIEIDEFDKGIRNIFNYGHSFGHSIESATKFAIPHGIAVTIGMDMANRIAVDRNLLPEGHYQRMHEVLRKNYLPYIDTKIPLDRLLAALKKDKKNTADALVLIMPVGANADVQKVEVVGDAVFQSQCKSFLDGMC